MALPAPSYANPGGTGDRTADITVTTSTGLVSQSPSNLVDGLVGSNNSEAVLQRRDRREIGTGDTGG